MQCSSQLRWLAGAATLAGLVLPSRAHAEDWLTFGKTVQRQGYNGQETTLSPQTVPGLQQYWQSAMNGTILTQPLLASGIPLDDGTGTGNTAPVDLVYVADVTGLAAAFQGHGRHQRDAWARQFYDPADSGERRGLLFNRLRRLRFRL